MYKNLWPVVDKATVSQKWHQHSIHAMKWVHVSIENEPEKLSSSILEVLL